MPSAMSRAGACGSSAAPVSRQAPRKNFHLMAHHSSLRFRIELNADRRAGAQTASMNGRTRVRPELDAKDDGVRGQTVEVNLVVDRNQDVWGLAEGRSGR